MRAGLYSGKSQNFDAQSNEGKLEAYAMKRVDAGRLFPDSLSLQNAQTMMSNTAWDVDGRKSVS